MGVLESEGILSKGIDVIMPAFEFRAATAAALDSSASNEAIDPLAEYRELRDPARLPVIDCVSAFVEFKEAAYPSSVCLSLYNFLPKNDLLEVPCLGFSGAVVGIVIAADAWKTAWALIQSLNFRSWYSPRFDRCRRKSAELRQRLLILSARRLGDEQASRVPVVIQLFIPS